MSFSFDSVKTIRARWCEAHGACELSLQAVRMRLRDGFISFQRARRNSDGIGKPLRSEGSAGKVSFLAPK